MKRRIFIAINLPEDIKRKLGEYQDKIEELFTPYRTEGSGSGPVRWTKKENLHITLLFIGSVSDQDIPEICRISREAASHRPVFELNLTKISYGPPKKMPPRMIWVAGQESEELARLQKDLENSLFTSPFNNAEGDISGKARYKEVAEPEKRTYAPHITLGRIRQWDFRRIEPDERPEVEKDISFGFEVSSIEVMESQLKRGGREYAILESAPLADSN